MLKTKNGQAIAVEELGWDNALGVIDALLPEFTDALRQCIPIRKLKEEGALRFYKASYPFGNDIIANRKCYLPLCNGGRIAFDDPQLPDFLREDLAYNPKLEDPVGLIINKNIESYINVNEIAQPHSIISCGQILGIPRATGIINNDPTTSSILSLNLSSGSKTAFILPKVAAQYHFRDLRRTYGIAMPPPTSPAEHWKIFVEIAKHTKNAWQCEVLYFPRKMIKLLTTPECAVLALYLLNVHRSTYNIWHNVAHIWNAHFDGIERHKYLNKYHMESLYIAKYLFVLAANSAVGFKPATTNDSVPLSLIQEAYANGYNSKSTIIMEPAKLSINSSDPIYYSLNHNLPFTQSTVDGAPKKRSYITLLEEIIRLVEIYRKTILITPDIPSSLYDIATSAEFSYYHTIAQEHLNIKDARLLVNEDARFSYNQHNEFPRHSAFLKGCIRISRKN